MNQLEAWVAKATHFSSHSGEVGEGGIFIALRGEKIDGNKFIADVLKKNVLGIVSDDKNVQGEKILHVENVDEAHWKIAGLFRKRFRGKVIAVGGSNGKTTTKEFLYTILSSKKSCIKTEKSQNGVKGLPRTLEKLREGVEMAVIEIGTDHPGEMKVNAALVDPDAGILTSIGEEHLELLKDLDGVFAEESELAQRVFAKKGIFLSPESDPYLAKLKAKGAKLISSQIQKLDPSFETPFDNEILNQNAALAAAMALEMGLSKHEVAAALMKLQAPDGRGLRWQIRPDLIVIRDHYNANPASMKRGLVAAKKLADDKKMALTLILGDMLELGASSEQAHKDMIELARSFHPKEFLWVGEIGKKWLSKNEKWMPSSKADLSVDKKNFLEAGIVLVKGSRGTALENVMDRIYGTYK